MLFFAEAKQRIPFLILVYQAILIKEYNPDQEANPGNEILIFDERIVAEEFVQEIHKIKITT